MHALAGPKIRSTRVANLCAITTALIGFALVIGWTCNLELLQHLSPGQRVTNPTTAALLLFVAASLAAFGYRRQIRRRPLSLWLGRAGAGVVLLVAASELISVVWGAEYHPARLLPWLQVAAEAMRRIPMAPNTACSFLLTGCGLLTLRLHNRRHANWTFFFALSLGLEALLAVIGYAFGVRQFYRVDNYAPMAFPTAVAFLAIAASLIGHQIDRNYHPILRGNNPGGRLARRLLPAAIFIPLIIGCLKCEGERLEIYDGEFAFALYTVTIMVVFAALVCRNAFAVLRADQDRARAERRLVRARDELEARVAERTAELSSSNVALQAAWNEMEQRVRERTASLAETQTRLQAILDHTPAIVFIKDLESRMLMVNRRFEQLFGTSNNEIAGLTSAAVNLPDAADRLHAEDSAVIESGTAMQFEDYLVLPSGETRFLVATKFPLRDATGEMFGIGGISIDITERKLAEQAAKVAREEAERANAAKSEFLSRMSHELRTPMNAILGFAQLLEMEDLTPDQRDAIRHILSGGDHLLDLINEILDIARIESGNLSLTSEPVLLRDQLRAALDLVQQLAADRKVRLELRAQGDCVALADRQRLKQVLINLVSNAIKYNRAGGSVTVTCERGLHAAQISVSDTGIGIPPERLAQLFTPFERLGAEQSGVEGTGLGLAVAKRLIEAMNGTIRVVSQPGHGTGFHLELPLAPVVRELPPSESAANGTTVGKAPPAAMFTVLYVEDNLSNFQLVERLLRRIPAVNLLGAPNGLSGLEMARKHLPDLILLDVNLPDMYGRDVLLCVHADAQCEAIPVVVISANSSPGEVERLMTAGAAAYLSKPIVATEFLALCQQHLPGALLNDLIGSEAADRPS